MIFTLIPTHSHSQYSVEYDRNICNGVCCRGRTTSAQEFSEQAKFSAETNQSVRPSVVTLLIIQTLTEAAYYT